MDDVQTKKALRARWRGVREGLSVAERRCMDGQIARNVCAHPAYRDATWVFAYLSVGSEVDTREIIRDAWSQGKQVAVPRCVPGRRLMEWYRIDSFEGLLNGPFGIQEPPANPAQLVEVPAPESGAKAIALVPGFSFDADGYRLGYGGGFYDVFLPEFGGVSLGLCRRAQLSTAPLPRDEFDVPVQFVMSD